MPRAALPPASSAPAAPVAALASVLGSVLGGAYFIASGAEDQRWSDVAGLSPGERLDLVLTIARGTRLAVACAPPTAEHAEYSALEYETGATRLTNSLLKLFDRLTAESRFGGRTPRRLPGTTPAARQLTSEHVEAAMRAGLITAAEAEWCRETLACAGEAAPSFGSFAVAAARRSTVLPPGDSPRPSWIRAPDGEAGLRALVWEAKANCTFTKYHGRDSQAAKRRWEAHQVAAAERWAMCAGES